MATAPHRPSAHNFAASEPHHPWFAPVVDAIYAFRPPHDVSDADTDTFCRWFAGWYARQGTPVGMICDLSEVGIVSARQRQIWTRFERGSESDFVRILRGVAIVLQSPITRGVVTATYWMNPPVYAYAIVETRLEAVSWLRRRL